jgi:Ca-activated chloride channel family protein
VDTFDLEVVRNILDDLPLDLAFDVGQTKLLDGLRTAAELARPWPPGSTALLLVSDGDTVPDQGFPEMPAAIGEALVLGVGDARKGKFIAGRQSRQDAATLRQLAARLRGVYHDANAAHLPSEHLARLAAVAPLHDPRAGGRRELALAATGLGAALLALVPVALAAWGSGWQPARRSGGVARRSNAAAPAGVTSLPVAAAPARRAADKEP